MSRIDVVRSTPLQLRVDDCCVVSTNLDSGLAADSVECRSAKWFSKFFILFETMACYVRILFLISLKDLLLQHLFIGTFVYWEDRIKE